MRNQWNPLFINAYSRWSWTRFLLRPVAGVAADRWDRGLVMAASGAASVMLLGTASGRYWVLYRLRP